MTSEASAALRVLVLPRYGRMGASSRVRMYQYLPVLGAHGVQCTMAPLFDDGMLRDRYHSGRYSRAAVVGRYVDRLSRLVSREGFDLAWIEKEALPWWPASVERGLLRGLPCVLDFDDAIFHGYDRHPRRIVRTLLGRRIDRLMAHASLVVAGNGYLADRARSAGAPWVEIVPTVVDLARYPVHPRGMPASVMPSDEVPNIVWIGSPSTAAYLQLLREPLRLLAARRRFRLRVIGAAAVDLPGVEVVHEDWSEAGEVAAILKGDIGVMPLPDSPWERGKCGYKLIQYMACGLPVVASAVGANLDIVDHAANGYLANDAEQWMHYLERLLDDPAERSRLGDAGRRRVQARFSVQAQGDRLAQLLIRAAR
jgi:glycosyltransferase involved in cell wall biosynthesis